MMKEQECPNCGGASPKVINEGEFRCNFCGTLFYDKEMMQRKKNADKKLAYAHAQQARYESQAQQARATSGMSKRVLLAMVVGLLIVFGFVGYMAKKSMDQATKAQEDMMKNFQK